MSYKCYKAYKYDIEFKTKNRQQAQKKQFPKEYVKNTILQTRTEQSHDPTEIRYKIRFWSSFKRNTCDTQNRNLGVSNCGIPKNASALVLALRVDSV